MSTVITVENLSKQYRLGNVGLGSLGADVNRWWQTRILGNEDPYLKIGEENDREVSGKSGYVWALRDINFDVRQGEVLGIIGRNGAGKSTLLKILSRTTGPTTGSIKIKGRVASLLEVGTGFHPELTGRENIFLNGAILGMTKAEIRGKFDEIVAFAGVERYVDTPVKRYSSGMYVRLAFAVAAHLEPEILIVDEVLAVGDAEFQKKAIGKMKEVSEGQGRTVLFVSHNMASVKSLTSSCILLTNGKILLNDETSKVVDEYYRLNMDKDQDLVYISDKKDQDEPFVSRVELCTTYQNNIQSVDDDLKIEFEIKVPTAMKDAALSYQIFNSQDVPVVHILNLNSENQFGSKPGIYNLTSIIPELKLYPDNYYLKVHFADHFYKKKFETLEKICPFEIKYFGEVRDYYWSKGNAIYLEKSNWKIGFKDNTIKIL